MMFTRKLHAQAAHINVQHALKVEIIAFIDQ